MQPGSGVVRLFPEEDEEVEPEEELEVLVEEVDDELDPLEEELDNPEELEEVELDELEDELDPLDEELDDPEELEELVDEVLDKGLQESKLELQIRATPISLQQSGIPSGKPGKHLGKYALSLQVIFELSLQIRRFSFEQ